MGVGGATVLCDHRALPQNCFQYSSTFMILLIIPRDASTLVSKVRGKVFPMERAAYFPTRTWEAEYERMLISILCKKV